jgi:alpha-galactosidase
MLGRTSMWQRLRGHWAAAISLLVLPLLVGWATPTGERVPLSALDLTRMKVQAPGWGGPGTAVALANLAVDGGPLRIGGKDFAEGVGTRANSVLFVRLAGGSVRFRAGVGVDDNPPAPSAGGAPARVPPPIPVVFRVLGDGRVLHVSKPLVRGDPVDSLSVDVRGVQTLVLQVKQVSSARAVAADWVNASFEVEGARPRALAIPVERRVVLTPKPGPAPRLNGPSLTGVTPGHDVLYRIPATGTRPMTFAVTGLPAGLRLDPATGIVTGIIAQPGRFPVTVRARNAHGSATRSFTFVAEGTLALTPALGWNSWNAYGRAISDSLARAAAQAMIAKGLADHGFTYINLDDGWARSSKEMDVLNEGPVRGPDGSIIPNHKFPDMRALGAFIHRKGLKFGIYTGPGPTTCEGLEGSWQHELQDFRTYADWGVDYIKYDWCGYSDVLAPGETNRQLPVLERPYRVARSALAQVPRDILYSLCQYGWGNVWEWGAEPEIAGNSWRTTGDINDSWESMDAIGFQQVGHSRFAGPGHWNDPDMLVIGKLGWGPELRPSRLTPNEQYVHITLWTLLAAPLLLGNDMAQMDAFDLNLVTNDEVLAVHQDPLGHPADRVAQQDELEVWARPLADGSLAVGLFNRDEMPMKVTAHWSNLGITGRQQVRDLWHQRDLGVFANEFSRIVPRHGTVFVKVTPVRRKR